jgi:hypothetical protein
MWTAIFLALLVTLVVTTGCIFAMTGAFRAEVEKTSPEYARRLFNSAGDMVWRSQWPIRIVPLFREPVPKGLEASVGLLRWITGVQVAIAIACFAVIGSSLLWYR